MEKQLKHERDIWERIARAKARQVERLLKRLRDEIQSKIGRS